MVASRCFFDVIYRKSCGFYSKLFAFMADSKRHMRPRTTLLWIRNATPGPAEIALMEGLDGFLVQVAHIAGDALGRPEQEHAGVIFAEFPLVGWEPADLLAAIQEINPRT